MAASRAAFFSLFAWAWILPAHDVISTKITWSQEISRLLYQRCASCHRDGGAAPMPLLTYQEVRPWAKAIKEEVHERRMPPGGVVKGFGEFAEDNSLNAEEIHLLADWVEGGAPEGDPQYLPPVPPAPQPVKLGAMVLTVIPDGFRLPGAVSLKAIAPPAGLSRGASLQAVAVRPDGLTVPLLWLTNFQPKQARAFRYRQPVRLPAGSVIRVIGAPGVRIAKTKP